MEGCDDGDIEVPDEIEKKGASNAAEDSVFVLDGDRIVSALVNFFCGIHVSGLEVFGYLIFDGVGVLGVRVFFDSEDIDLDIGMGFSDGPTQIRGEGGDSTLGRRVGAHHRDFGRQSRAILARIKEIHIQSYARWGVRKRLDEA